MTASDDSVAQLRKDHTSLASSLSAVTIEVGAIKTEQAIVKAVAGEQRQNLDDRLERIEKSLEGLYGLGKWMAFAIGASLITVVVKFVTGGGLNVPPGS